MTDAPTSSAIVMYGADWCRDCRRSKKLLDGLGVAYRYVDLEQVEGAAAEAQAVSGRTNIPVVVLPDGSHLVEPTDRELETRLVELGITAVPDAVRPAAGG